MGSRIISSRGSQAWLFQRITAILIFILLGTHVLLYHYLIGPGDWGYDILGFGAANLADLQTDPNLMKYYSLARVFANPLWKVFDVAMISAGTYHGFYGIKTIIDDWITHDGWRTITNWITYMTGFTIWVIGVVAVISFTPELV